MSRFIASTARGVAILALSLALARLSRNPSASPSPSETPTAQKTSAAAAAPAAGMMSTRDSIALVRDLGVILAILIFYIGWLFSYFYLYHFGVTMSVMDAPIYTFYFYPINVIMYIAGKSTPAVWAAVAVTCFAVLLFFVQYAKARLLLRRHLAFILIILVAAWLIGGFFVARNAASETAGYILGGSAPVVKFAFKEDGSLAGANASNTHNPGVCPDNASAHVNRICAANLQEQFLLVGETKTHFLVLFRAAVPPDAPDVIKNRAQRAHVYHIPLSDVAAAVVIPPQPGSTAASEGGTTR